MDFGPIHCDVDVRGCISAAFLHHDKLRFLRRAGETTPFGVGIHHVCSLLEAVLHGSCGPFAYPDSDIVGVNAVLNVRDFVQLFWQVYQGYIKKYWRQDSALRRTPTSAYQGVASQVAHLDDSLPARKKVADVSVHFFAAAEVAEVR